MSSFVDDFSRSRLAADKARLMELGGRERTVAEEAEWHSLFMRGTAWNVAYFEQRLWERPTRTF